MGEPEDKKQEGDFGTVEEWWDDCHKTRGSFFVSDYNGSELWNSLNISDRIVPGASVLEIGVGDGGDVKELHAKGVRVHALDITPAALQKVAEVTERGWLESQIESLPQRHFDVAISHLVTQHISNEALSRQIRCVLRSLTRTGIFAMQFADHINGIPNEQYREELEAQQKGGVCRNLGMMRQIARDNGGRIVWVSDPRNFPEYGSRWFFIHIRRRRFWFLGDAKPEGFVIRD